MNPEFGERKSETRKITREPNANFRSQLPSDEWAFDQWCKGYLIVHHFG